MHSFITTKSNWIAITPTRTAVNLDDNCNTTAAVTVWGLAIVRSLSAKGELIDDMISEHRLDIMAVFENWFVWDFSTS